MKKIPRPALIRTWAAVLFLAAASTAFSQVIAVDFGRYPGAEGAARDEARVNWSDRDVTDDTVCTASFAAVELQGYLRRITGNPAAFPIVRPADAERIPGGPVIRLATFDQLGADVLNELGLTASAAAELGREGYVLKTLARSGRPVLLVAGPTRVGVLYGAYDLLHRLGVRWYAPGALQEEVPRGTLVPFPAFDARERPGFVTRGFHAWENRADRDFLLWMARNRLNYWCVEQEEKPLLHKLGIQLVGGAHLLTSLYLNPKAEYPYAHPRAGGAGNKPADPYPVSLEFKGDLDGDGKISYFEAHPEWFGLRGGKRSPRIEGDFGDNFCTSNKEALAEWTKNAVRDLAEGRYKDADIMNAWTLDGGNWCECDACRALGTPTDRNILFVHAYAEAIKKAQAEKRIQRPIRLLFLAYADVLEPPTRPLPADFDPEMSIATYFPIRRCYVHAFNDPDCPANAEYEKALRGWFVDPGRFYRGQACIGEYYNVSGTKGLPAVFMHAMAADIPYYYSIGARHFHYMHVTTGAWGSKALTNWQMARQLWDPAAPAEELWRDYFAGRYGPAAGLMRRYYESLESMLSNVAELKYGLARRLADGAAVLFPDRHLRYGKRDEGAGTGPCLADMLESARSCRALLKEAAGSGLPETFAARVAEDERVFTYAERTLLFYDALVRTKVRLESGGLEAARASLREAEGQARLLQADTVSTKLSSSHANAADALEASFAAPALKRFGEILAKSGSGAVAQTPVYADKFGLLVTLDAAGVEHPVKTAADWEIRKKHILLNFQKAAGRFPDTARRVPPNVSVAEERDLGDVLRKKITFTPEPGSLVRAYLFIPKGARGRVPAVLCLHQTTPRGKDEPAGLNGDGSLAYALELARRGYVTLAPDYPGYGEDRTDPYALGYDSATMKGIWNHLRSVDVLEALPQVDPARLAVIGHSLGGHNSIFAALFDPRLKAVVTSCGFTSFEKYCGGNLAGWSHPGYMPWISFRFGKDPRLMPFDFPELLAALAPRPVFVNAPLGDENFDASGVDDCLRAAAPVYALLGAPGGVTVIHPKGGHGFPREARAEAYRFLDRVFSRPPGGRPE